MASLHLREAVPNCTYREHKKPRKVTHAVVDDAGEVLERVCRGCATAALSAAQAIEDGAKRGTPSGMPAAKQEMTPEEADETIKETKK